MSIEQRAAYKAYRAACRVSNVEPVLKDFIKGDIPSCVRTWCHYDGVVLPQRDFLVEQDAALVELRKATLDIHKAEYNLYRAACLLLNVSPSAEAFDAGEIPDGVVSFMEEVQNGEAMAATA